MCYPKPGPRCSAHAKKSLKIAARAHKKDPNSDAKLSALLVAREDFEATPEGFKSLEKAIDKSPRDKELQTRLDDAKMRRQLSLEALGSIDVGDVKETDSAKWQGALILSEAHRAGLKARKEAMMREEYDRVEVEKEVNDPNQVDETQEHFLPSRETNFSIDADLQRVYATLPSEIKQATKDIEDENSRWRLHEDTMQWGFKGPKNALNSGRGDAYNEAYAEVLRKHGIEDAKVGNVPLPEDTSELHDLFSRRLADRETFSHKSYQDKEVIKAFQEVTETLKDLKMKNLSEAQIYRETQNLCLTRYEDSKRAGLDITSGVWKRISAMVRWSNARNRRLADPTSFNDSWDGDMAIPLSTQDAR